MPKPISSKHDPFEGWQPYCRRYVAVFNITSLIDYNVPVGLKKLDVFEKLIRLAEAAENIEHMHGINNNVIHGTSASGKLRFFPFYDKVILATIDDSSESDTVMQLAALAFYLNAFGLGLPVRGAIVNGEAIIDIEKNICVGQAFLDAISLLETQQWLGVLFHDSTQINKQINENVRDIADDDIPLSIYTDVPLIADNQSCTREMSVLNWPVFLGSASNALEQLNEVKSVLGLKSTSIYYNTVRFINQQLS